MTGETRVALLLGLIFIFAFGLVLGEITGSTPSDPVPAAKLRDVEYLAKQPNQQDRNPYAPARQEQPRRRSRPREWSSDGFAVRPAPEQAEVHVSGQQRPGGQRVVEVQSRRQRSARPERQPRTPERASSRPGRSGSTYTIRKGDTLYGIARREYGEDQTHLWRRIYQANRDVLSSPTNMPVGTDLKIPAVESAEPERHPTRADRGGRRVREVSMDDLAEELRAGTGGQGYVTQPGDNLTEIARKTLGDGSREAVQRLYEANRGRLPDPDVVPVGVELTIPSS
ncbi:MAG: LysM peptidoglycan-binding domain-containing protein [Planctomycetota bacterium]